MSSVRRSLSEDEYLLISSYYENILASRAQIWDIADFSRITFIFGHYIHEGLLNLLQPKTIWDIFLFTGVREPRSRSVSQYYQLAKVSQSYPEIDEFMSSYGASMCDEILRAFPSLFRPDKPKWINAAEVLTAFDYIYSTEDYTKTIGPVYESIGLIAPANQDAFVSDNVRRIQLNPDIATQIRTKASESDGTKLYSLIKPAIGQANAGRIIADILEIDRKREQLFSSPCTSRPIDFDYRFHFNLMGYELHLLGGSKKAEVIQILEQKRNRLNELLDFLSTREY